MTCGLPQAEQGFEDMHARLVHAHAVHALANAELILQAQALVEIALLGLELHLECLLDTRGKFGCHHVLRAAQNHRP